jgi:hypothetical protein
MPTLYPKKALMYDTENFEPTDGQMFQWSSESDGVIPVSPSVGGVIVQSGSGTGADDVLVASFAIVNNSTISITGTVNVTSIGTSKNYNPGDCAAWNFSNTGSILVNYDSGASFSLEPVAYDQSEPLAYPEVYMGVFGATSLYVTCAGNMFYLYYMPDVGNAEAGDSWITKCSLNVSSQTYV